MEIKTLILSPLMTNCYIVKTGETTGLVIDPADDAEKIIKTASDMGIEKIEKILLTHGHFDHIGAAVILKEKYNGEAKIYINENDSEMLEDGVKSLAYFIPENEFVPFKADAFVNNGDEIEQDGYKFSVMHTPGHSAGSVCYIVNDGIKNIMFAGDTIFKDSIGRSDFYSSDRKAQTETLEKIKSLKEDYVILSGHGPATTLSTEKKYNPYISDF